MSIAIIRGRIGNVKKRLSSLPISHKNTLLLLCNYDNTINVLLYSYRLCQVARLINITVALHCDIVCQKLHRNNRKRSGKFIQALRQAHDVLADRLVPGEIVRGDEHDACAARYNLTDIGDCFLEQCRLRCQSNNQSTLLDQRNRAVLKLTGSVRLRMNIAKFPSA